MAQRGSPDAGAGAADAAHTVALRKNNPRAAAAQHATRQAAYNSRQRAQANASSSTKAPDPGGQPTEKLAFNGKNTKLIQKMLVDAGYPIHVDGVIGPATKSALQWYKSGKSTHDWQPPHNAAVVTLHPNGKVTKSGTVGSTLSGSNSGKTKVPSLPNGNVGNNIPESLAQGGAQTIDPSAANAQAGVVYDPQIREQKTLMTRQPLEAAQHQHDIKTWYNQVQQSLKTAASRNQTAATDATTNIGNVGRDVLSSIGGSANQGAQTVAAQTQADAAMQAQLGQNEQQYSNDLAPILQDEAAGQRVSQTNKDSLNAQNLAQQLQGLQGQRGQAVVNAQTAIQGQNNTILDNRNTNLLNIKNSNNSLAQQRFSNALSAQTAAIAAAMSNAQIKAYNSSSSSAASGGFVPWAKLNPSQKQQLIQAAMGNVTDASGALMGNQNAASGSITQYLQGQGYNSILHPTFGAGAQMTGMINSALTHAQQLLAQRQAAAAAAGTSYNG